jgi:hypothetical protein
MRFCPACGKAQGAKRRTKPLLVAVTALVCVAIAGYCAWTVPIKHTYGEAHFPWVEGADFYLFNRCDMFVILPRQKWTFPGQEQNGACALANPADAFREIQLEHGNAVRQGT